MKYQNSCFIKFSPRVDNFASSLFLLITIRSGLLAEIR